MKNFKKQNQMTFNEALEKLSTTHTTTIGDICNDLKTPRPWVSRYITPYLDKIYLPNGYGTSFLPWNLIALSRLGKELKKDCIYYNTEEYESLIKNALVSSKRQTISCSPLVFLNDNQKKNFLIFFRIAIQTRNYEIEKNRNDKKISESSKSWIEYDIKNDFYGKLFDEFLKYFEDNFGKEELKKYRNFSKNKKRSNIDFVDYNCSFDINKLLAVHDLKGYDGVDEMIYRDLFNYGAIKLEFHFKDNKGNQGKKIFYYYDDANDGKYRLKEEGDLKEINYWNLPFPYTWFLNHKKI